MEENKESKEKVVTFDSGTKYSPKAKETSDLHSKGIDSNSRPASTNFHQSKTIKLAMIADADETDSDKGNMLNDLENESFISDD